MMGDEERIAALERRIDALVTVVEELLHGSRADRDYIRQFLDVARSKDGKPPPPKLVSLD